MFLKFLGFRPKPKGTPMRTDISQPYNWTDNRVDPNSQDFQNVMAWIGAHSYPAPKASYLMLGGRGVALNLPPDPLYLTFPGISYPVDATLVMNDPASTLNMLDSIAKWNLAELSPYTPPSPPATPPPAPVPQPDNPVGSLMNELIAEGNSVVIPEKRRRATGDRSPAGAVYPVPEAPGQPQFRLVDHPTPFGDVTYWARIDNIPAGATQIEW